MFRRYNATGDNGRYKFPLPKMQSERTNAHVHRSNVTKQEIEKMKEPLYIGTPDYDFDIMFFHFIVMQIVEQIPKK
jgi:hypothetical protein